jgi:hypothetical protein
LYISSQHKKGEHCQSIKPYLASNNYYDDNYTSPDSTLLQ